MRIPRAETIAAIGLFTGSLALLLTAHPAAALPAAALTGAALPAAALPAEVTPLIVPGTAAPVFGADIHLPPLSQTRYYDAGRGPTRVIREYQSSGRYAQDQQAVAAKAEAFLADWLATTCGDTSQAACRPVAVFDIDDTLLNWYPVLTAHDFTSTSAQRAAAVKDCTTPAIAPVRALLKKAKVLGADVFLLSGRSEGQRADTEACLRKRGITGWAKLTLRSAKQESLSANGFKSAQRAQWELDGWRLALNIGDQVSDLAGGHAAAGFLLPNPMYYIP